MKDESLEHEIESLLTAEPPPEFLARVRARVAEEPEPRRSHASWRYAGAAAVAAVIVALVLWTRESAPPKRAAVERQTVADIVDASAPPSPRIAEVVQPATPPARPPASPEPPLRRSARPAAPARDERILVAPEDAKAFDALLSTIRERDVVLVFDESRESALSASTLAIEPIAIDPLPDILEGGVE